MTDTYRTDRPKRRQTHSAALLLSTKFIQLISLICALSIVQLNTMSAVVDARRLPTSTTTAASTSAATSQSEADEINEIVLEPDQFLHAKVAAHARVYIQCTYPHPVWYKNDARMGTKSREIIKFEKIKLTHAAVYSCRPDGTNGQWSNVSLEVLSPKDFEQLQLLHEDAEDTQWQTIDSDVQSDQQHESHDNNDTSTIINSNYNEKNPDQYAVSTESGPNQESAEAAEPGMPAFKTDDSRYEKFIIKPSGSTINIKCQVIDTSNTNITWSKDGGPIDRKMGRAIYKKWSVSMEDGIPEDSGYYKCTVCNLVGCIERITKVQIHDRVNHKPFVSEEPKNLTLYVGQSGEMRCTFYSDLFSTTHWVFKTIVITDSPSANQSVQVDPDKPDTLIITNVTHEDEGWYTCSAANSLGHTVASAYLSVIDEVEIEPIHPSKKYTLYMTLIKIGIGLCFLFGVIFILTIVRKMKHDNIIKHQVNAYHQWTKKVIIYKPNSDVGSSDTIVMPVIKIEKQHVTHLQNGGDFKPCNEYEFPLDAHWEIPRSQLVLDNTLGYGEFGLVMRGELSGLTKSTNDLTVAVKMVKDDHSDADIASLVHEMEVMKIIGNHVNINNLIGCCSQDGPLYVIVEYAPHGSLKSFLRANDPQPLINDTSDTTLLKNAEDRMIITQKDFISFSYQIARGMEYLASRKCIHRDVAARNVLVSHDYVMKICDFGLARDIHDTDYYRKNTNGKLPIKWMAPESIQEKFYDSQSDVWSYGVLLWEMYTYCRVQPLANVTPDRLYSYLKLGHRMERPSNCSLNMYMLMRQCWNFEAHARPSFSEIVENLDQILTVTANVNEEYLDLGVPLLETPPSSDDELETETTEILRENMHARYKNY